MTDLGSLLKSAQIMTVRLSMNAPCLEKFSRRQ
jgi:hypothetical protein